jgi:hypothetical protein
MLKVICVLNNLHRFFELFVLKLDYRRYTFEICDCEMMDESKDIIIIQGNKVCLVKSEIN